MSIKMSVYFDSKIIPKTSMYFKTYNSTTNDFINSLIRVIETLLETNLHFGRRLKE